MTLSLWIERAFSAGFLLAGLSHLLHPGLWTELFLDLLRSRYAPLVVAVYTLPMGLFIVVGHNVWAWDVAVCTTLAGWMMVLKSAVYLVHPKILGLATSLDHRKFNAAGAVMTALGVWMVYGAFLRA